MTATEARIWRRGPEPRPAGDHDLGYFGPESVIWQVAAHPATVLMAAQTTALLEAAHRGMQAVMLGHDPALRAAIGGSGHAQQFIRRLQRTVGVPVPMIFGDTETADRIAAHLRGVHGPMRGIVPGTADEPYGAGSPELVVFAHVTIFHAFLRNYEALAFRDGRPPARLPDHERDRYFAELVPFAELMGAPQDAVPDSAAAVAGYYASIAGAYGEVDGYRASQLSVLLASLRPARWRDLRFTAAGLGLDASGALAMTIVPRAVRRQVGVPAALDPALDAALAAIRPSFAALSVPAVGDRVVRGVAGPDALALTRAARTTMASHEPARREARLAA
jgi:uncharacterized protein (DUF2236 family)